ncbi:MAG: hypothetical protein KGL93_07400 [Gemmatimonadota bacterium]|nr:hypothetical protein [Gemmatimonadota bacterium]
MTPRHLFRRGMAALLALGVTAPMLAGQGTDPLAKLDTASRRVVLALVDSANAEGLPTAPIVSKAQEGVSKHAAGPLIARVVRTVFLSLREARATLGEHANRDELTAGAAALQAGIPATALIDLRQAGHGKSITVPLVVLADLVSRGVPRDTASRAILQLWMGGAGEADLMGLSQSVGQDILSGAAPADALLSRARKVPIRLPPAKVPE